jgi:hypothetical protein
MAKVRKRRIRWSESPATEGIVYKLYWSVSGSVDYDSDSAVVGMRTEIILPDDVPTFPLVNADIEIGVTAVNELGNESDMTKLLVPFEFATVEAPKNLVVETAKEYYFSNRGVNSKRPE